MVKFLLGIASIALAIAFMAALGFAAHDGGATPYQGVEFSGI